MGRLFAGLTDRGVVRPVNQDSYYVDPQGRFFIVADGMGGHAGGQEASRIATEVIRLHLEKYWQSSIASEQLLEESFVQANKAILSDQEENPERAEMGTTAVVVAFREDQPWCAHVGDSRLYQLQEEQLKPVTEDHTWVAWALRAGTITPSEATVHPLRHVLSQCLGRRELYNIEIQSLEVKTGDRLLLCSDGLTGEVSDEEILGYLSKERDCEEAASKLVEAAKDNGGSDNITVVIVAEVASEGTQASPDETSELPEAAMQETLEQAPVAASTAATAEAEAPAETSEAPAADA